MYVHYISDMERILKGFVGVCLFLFVLGIDP